MNDREKSPLDAAQLDRLLGLVSDRADSNSEAMQAIHTQLHKWLHSPLDQSSSLPDSLREALSVFEQSILEKPLIDQLLNPETKPTVLQAMAYSAQEYSLHVQTPAEEALALTLYHGCLAGLLVFHHQESAEHSLEDLIEIYTDLQARGWLPSQLKGQFNRACQICRQKLASNGNDMVQGQSNGVCEETDLGRWVEEVGSQLGGYKILSLLGEGGMGLVYLAEQQKPIKRRVALKLIKPGMDTKPVIARFEAERQALALLDHPHIAHVFNAGTTKAGRPYFAMEYVQGVPITDHCDRCKLTIEERLKLVLSVCDAVQHAHQKAIIHRDIKPSNILVAYEGEQATPMIIDFGVAKALSQSLTERTLVTEQAQMIGTPEYMSPEQAEMTGQDIDTRTDVYSLGVLLYELLTGTLPFDPKTLRESGPESMRRIIREQEPKAPSVLLSTIGNDKSLTLAQQRRTDTRTLGRHLKGELDWITLKAMDKDRTRRYQTTYALAEDIQRYLNKEPVLAGPPTAIYKLRKFVMRNKGFFISAAAMAVVVILAAIVSITLAIMATGAKIAETEQRQKAEILAKQQEEDLYFNYIKLAQHELKTNRPAHALELLNKCPKSLRNWEWNYLNRSLRLQTSSHLEFGAEVVSFDLNPDNSMLAALCVDGRLIIRDRVSGEELSLQVREGYSDQLKRNAYWETIQWVTFSSDGAHIAVVGDENVVRLLRVSSGEDVKILAGHTDTLFKIAFASDGSMLATASSDSTVRIWDIPNGDLMRTIALHQRPASLAFSQDGKRLFIGTLGAANNFSIYDPRTGQMLSRPPRHSSSVLGMAISGDGQWLATASWDNTIALSKTAEHTPEYLEGHVGGVYDVAFTSDGTRLASISGDLTARLWDVTTGREIMTMSGFTGAPHAVFSKDDRELVVGDGAGKVIVFDASPVIEPELLDSRIFARHRHPVYDVDYSPSGDELVSVSQYEGSSLWDASEGQKKSVIRAYSGFDLAYSYDGGQIASIGTESGSSSVKVQEAKSPHRELFSWKIDRQQAGISFTADDQYLLVGGSEAIIRVFNWRTNTLHGELGVQDSAVVWIAASCDGRYIVSTGGDGEVLVWDATRIGERQSGRVVHRRAARAVFHAEFSPDSRRLAVGGYQGDITILDVETGEMKVYIPRAHGDQVPCVVFSPDGKYIASCSPDQTVRVWEADTGRPIEVLIGHVGAIYSVVWSPDGKQIASGGHDKTIRIWTPRLE